MGADQPTYLKRYDMRKTFARTAAALAIASAAIVPLSGIASAHDDDSSGMASGSATTAISVGGHDGVTTFGNAGAAAYWMEQMDAGTNH
ncbi:hypothetical protein GCM10010361_30550 [Streptomyces olivaceiscleroticus]|uniref:Uncharacterized protein n=2 Tax=Streptomyces olivaceiscleroticus TaxID=68245 RepID=A0ABN1A0B5_9ACTN